HLGAAQQQRHHLRAGGAEGVPGHHHGGQAGAGAEEADRGHVGAEHAGAHRENGEELREGEAHPDARPGHQGGCEDGEPDQHHADRDHAAACGAGDRGDRVVGIDRVDGPLGPVLAQLGPGHRSWPSAGAPSSAASTPMSSLQISGRSAIIRSIRAMHSGSSSTSTLTPRSRSRSSAISKLRFSPTTIRGISYSRAVPEHMMHGERVVYSPDSRYTLARRRPAFSIVSVSPCRIAESFCTRWLWPAASTSPSWTSTAPIGTPPSSQLFVAC